MGKEKVLLVTCVVRIVTQLSPKVSTNLGFVTFHPPQIRRKKDAKHHSDAKSQKYLHGVIYHIGHKIRWFISFRPKILFLSFFLQNANAH